jgi:hypothetical protein
MVLSLFVLILIIIVVLLIVFNNMQNKYILKWALGIGIIIVLNLFFHFATRLVYKIPEYEDFCQSKQVEIRPDTEESCVAEGGAWITPAKEYYEEAPMTPPIGAEKAYCDPTYTCRQEFEDVRDVYQRNVFVVMVVLGLVSLILGFALAANEAISLGLSYGGILSFIIASIQYWSAMDDYLRVIILALALAILIYLGYRKFK